jgi:hypothetical protein
MTRETKDELLLIMLFFGFLLFSGSLLEVAASATFPCPKLGVFVDTLSCSLAKSTDGLPSLSLSLMLNVFRSVAPLEAPVA